jgi:ABC-type uncharacterized transport system auxiliary subunit
MNKNCLTFIAVLLMASIVSACSLPGAQPIPEDHFYRLPAASVSRPVAQRFERLLIRPVQVAGLYHERAVLYVEQAQPLEIHRYRYHFWVQPPARLVAGYMHDWLTLSAVAGMVTDQSDARPALEISPVISGFERLLADDGVQVRVTMSFKLAYPGGRQRTLKYQEKRTAAGNGMYDSAVAFGVALDALMQRLLADLVENNSP